MKKTSFARIHILALIFGCIVIHAANVEPVQNPAKTNNNVAIEPTRNPDGTTSWIVYPDRKPSVAIEAARNGVGTVIGNPYISPLSLLLPSENYAVVNVAIGVRERNSGYFTGMDKDARFAISGWFESARKFKYKNVKDLWRSQKHEKANNTEYLKINDWDVMLYDFETRMAINNKPIDMAVLRANLLKAGTWLRLRLSDTSATPEGIIALRKRLVRYVEAIQVTASKPRPFQLEHSSEAMSIISTAEKPGHLLIKSKDIQLLQYDTADNPGLFVFQDFEEKLKITAWLRPASDYHYATPAMLWDEAKAVLAKNNALAAGDFTYEKIQGWDVMVYDIKTDTPKKNDVTMRASRVIDGTWFDIQLTSSDQRTSASLRSKLKKYMKKIVATGGQAEN